MKKHYYILAAAVAFCPNLLSMKLDVLDKLTPLPKVIQKIVYDYLNQHVVESVFNFTHYRNYKNSSQQALNQRHTATFEDDSAGEVAISNQRGETVKFGRLSWQQDHSNNSQITGLIWYLFDLKKDWLTAKASPDVSLFVLKYQDQFKIYDKHRSVVTQVPCTENSNDFAVSHNNKYLAVAYPPFIKVTQNFARISIMTIENQAKHSEILIKIDGDESIQRIGFVSDGSLTAIITTLGKPCPEKTVLIWRNQAIELEQLEV